MFKIMFKSHWILLALSISLASLFPLSSMPANVSQSSLTQSITPSPSQLPPVVRRRPRSQLGGRGDSNLCVISPGLMEQQNVIWSDRPLFLWQAQPVVALQRLRVIDQSGKILWEKPLAATEQRILYAGQPLQPGQFYTWQLKWMTQNTEHASDYTFQLMEPAQRNQIDTELQALTRQLQASGSTPESIADQQADYLLNRSQPLWSDALQVLSTVENPSTQTTQKLQSWITTVCGAEEK
jgi:hypothetical protein